MKMLGEAILYSSIQFAIGSVEMSSKFSVKNFSKDAETLQNAADALADYIKIGILWTIGTSLLLYCNYGPMGAYTSIVVNAVIIAWIYFSYLHSFKLASQKNNLPMPRLNFFKLF
jgi:hypothetical protein